MKTRYLALCLFLVLAACRIGYYASSGGFSLQRIENTIPHIGVTTPEPTSEVLTTLQTICAQPFSYLGKGSQSYVFQSLDGQYVLKLFKSYHLRALPWLEDLSLYGPLEEYRQAQLAKRWKKTKATLNSYAIAASMLQEECGLYFLQIYPSSLYHQNVTFTDKIGRTYTIDLSQHGFLVQKKGALIFPTLEQWIQEKKHDQARAFLHSLVQLMAARSRKGIHDHDPDLHKNAGCLGTQAYFIDVGGLQLSDNIKLPKAYTADIRKITRPLDTWLRDRCPELACYLDAEIAAL